MSTWQRSAMRSGVCKGEGRPSNASAGRGSRAASSSARCLRPRAELEAALAPLPALALEGLPSPLHTPDLIAERCHVDLELGTFHFPQVPLPRGETAYSQLAKRCFRGIEPVSYTHLRAHETDS